VGQVILVRHGQAEASWGEHPDPGLSALGRAQAEEAAEFLAPLGPWPIVTSPLRRCRETATPLARRWQVEPVVDPAVGEVASPPGLGLGGRSTWLAEAMAGSWSSLPLTVRDWRDGVVVAVSRLAGSGDAVVFTHFVAINAVLSWAWGDDRVCVHHPDNCSRTTIERDSRGDLVVVELGGEAATHVG
jgi:broad specificity phosphatase PhoE